MIAPIYWLSSWPLLTPVLTTVRSVAECGDRVKAKLANISRAVAVDDLTLIAEGLSDIRQDLNVSG